MERPVIYQLFVRHFAQEKEALVPNGSLKENGSGKFNAITQADLEKIKELGMTHVWLTGVLRHATDTSYAGLPAQSSAIVKGKAGSPYAVVDYYDVDPDLAEDVSLRLDEFVALLGRCRAAGLIPMMDFIPNHVSRDYASTIFPERDFGAGDDKDVFFSSNNGYFYLQLGKQNYPQGLKLPVAGQRYAEEAGRVTGNNVTSWEPSLYDWYETVKLNYGYDFTRGVEGTYALPGAEASEEQVPKTWGLMDKILAYWQGLGVGGFRCDMAHLVPMPFWSWVLERVRARQPEALMIAEAYNDDMKTTWADPAEELLSAGFDYVYEAPFYHELHALYEEGHWANDLERLCVSDSAQFYRSVRYLENHDEPRLGSLKHWGGKGSQVAPALAAVMYFISGGAILFYNGQEVGERAEGVGGYGGDNGRTSIFDYTSLPQFLRWRSGGTYSGAGLSVEERKEATFLYEAYRYLGGLYQQPAFVRGGFFGLNYYNRLNVDYGKLLSEESAGHWIFSFLRYDGETKQAVLVVANLHPEWSFNHVHLLVPPEAFEWMGWQDTHVNFHVLGSKTPVSDPYSKEELRTSGFEFSLLPGQAKFFELFA